MHAPFLLASSRCKWRYGEVVELVPELVELLLGLVALAPESVELPAAPG